MRTIRRAGSPGKSYHEPARRRALRMLGAALAVPVAARAQNGRSSRIGYLAPDARSTRNHEGFREGMQALGFVEGRNLTVDWRFADGRYDALPGLAADIVGRNPDAIVAATSLGVQAVAHATKSVPIVMVAVADPVGEGFAKSLANPGGNITGLSSIVTEVSAKHVELLQTALPKLSRAALLINPHNPTDALILEQVQGTAYSRRLRISAFEAGTPADIDQAFARMAASRSEAVIVAADPFFDAQWQKIAELALRNRMASIFSSRGAAEAGALMSYGQDMAQHCRRAALYVQKILDGASPRSLPIEQPTTFEMVVNQRTANLLGLAMPREILVRADKVID